VSAPSSSLRRARTTIASRSGRPPPAAGGLITVELVGGGGFVSRVSGDARRLVGSWPTPETALDRMIEALEAIAANIATDEDTRSRARKLLDGFQSAGRDVASAAARAAITSHIPT
jgi:hypothetical protein